MIKRVVMLDPELAYLLRRETPREVCKSYGIPHPLAHFGLTGKFIDGMHADILCDWINSLAWNVPDSVEYRCARWLLLESERTFATLCEGAGIDGLKLREHLRRVVP